MNKTSFGRGAQKVCETIHAFLMLGLVIGVGVSAGTGPRSAGMTFFQHLLSPLVVVLIIIALGVINFLVAELIGKLFPDPTPLFPLHCSYLCHPFVRDGGDYIRGSELERLHSNGEVFCVRVTE